MKNTKKILLLLVLYSLQLNCRSEYNDEIKFPFKVYFLNSTRSIFKDNCKTPISWVAIIDTISQDTITKDYLSDLSKIEYNLRTKFDLYSLYEREKNFNRLDSSFHRNKIEIYEKNTEIINYLLLNNFKYGKIENKTNIQNVAKLVAQIERIDGGGQIFHSLQPNWDSLINSLHTENIIDTKKSIERFQYVSEQLKHKNNSSFILIKDVSYKKWYESYIFLFTFIKDNSGHLHLKKELLNPEAAFYKCE